jgi:hypothetical protein
MLRYSIRQLLVFMAFVGVGCVALLNSSRIWAAGMMAAVVVSLTAATVLAIFSQRAARSYWIGFALSGWLYLLFCIYGFASSPSVSANPRRYNSDPLGREDLITAQLSGFAYERLLAERRLEFIQKHRPKRGLPSVVSGMDRDYFIVVSHALWAWLLAACSGYFARWLYTTRSSRAPDERP